MLNIGCWDMRIFQGILLLYLFFRGIKYVFAFVVILEVYGSMVTSIVPISETCLIGVLDLRNVVQKVISEVILQILVLPFALLFLVLGLGSWLFFFLCGLLGFCLVDKGTKVLLVELLNHLKNLKKA